MVSHVATSAKNPIHWGELFKHMQTYYIRSPLGLAHDTPGMTMYKSDQYFKSAMFIKRKLPKMVVGKIQDKL